MFTEALFTIAKTWKQHQQVPINRWIDKDLCVRVYTMEYYSATKKNEILPFLTSWRELEGYYAKWNKSEKDKYHVTSLMSGISKNKTNEQT